MDRRRLDLKARTAGTRGANDLRVKHAEKRSVARSNERSKAFARGRNMEDFDEMDVVSEEEQPTSIENTVQPDQRLSKAEKLVVDARRIRLEKWKQEKLQKEALMKSQQKPIFKTGVVHHSVGSPNVFGVPTAPVVNTKLILQPRNGATTRAMRTNMMRAQAPQPVKPIAIQAISKNKKFQAPVGLKAVAMLTIPTTPKGMSGRKKLQVKVVQANGQPPKVGRSLAFPVPKQNNLNQQPSLPKMTAAKVNPSESKRKLAQPVANNVNPLTPGVARIMDAPQETVAVPKKSETPVVFRQSPFVTVERGKFSDRRKSVKSKLADTSLPLTVPIKSLSMDDGDRITVASEDVPQHPAIRYRNILNGEVSRLKVLCEEWTALKTEHASKLSDNVNSLVDLAIGQTQLLIRSKFEQFRGLTFDCEKGECAPPVTPEDLQGFWEMVYIQVENVDRQFVNLTELKANNFAEKSPTKPVTKKTNPKKASKPVASRPIHKSSGIRALIEAQRRKKQEEASRPVTPGGAQGGTTPRQSTLLKDVLRLSAVRRSVHLSPIIMRVSHLAKNVGSPTPTDGPTDDTLLPRTPFKSILKDVTTVKDSRKTVNFGESTVKNLTPDFNVFESPADEPPANSELRIVNSPTEQKMDVGASAGTPPGLPPVSLPRSTSLKRRTRGSYRNRQDTAETTEEDTSDVDKENLASKIPISNKVRTRKSASFLEYGTPLPNTPTPDRPRRSYRNTPYKNANHEGSEQQRVSLLPGMEQIQSPLAARKFSNGNLISFATPLRRSTRASRKN